MTGREPVFPEGLEEDEPSSPLVRTLLPVVAIVAVAAVAVGLFALVSVLTRDTTTETAELDLSDAPQLAVRAGQADLRFVEGRSDELVVRARITSGVRKTHYALQRKGDDFIVDSSCQGWLSPGCGVQVTFEVPAGVPIVVATAEGDVTLRALKGRVVTAATASGDVRASSLAVTELSARSTSGDIAATFAKQPFAVKLATRSGDVSARIPKGRIGYQVTVDSASGDVRNALTSTPGGQGLVRVTSRSGDVRLAGS